VSAATLIGFDTATPDVAVAVMRGGEALTDVQLAPDGGPRHASELMPQIEAAAAVAGGWETIDSIAIGIGPGSFTGLRIGIATARALAQALAKPVTGVGTLDALAAGIAERAAEEGRPVLAVLDARRRQAFAALRDAAGAPVWEPFVAAPDELAARVAGLAETPLAGGDGSLRFRRDLEQAGAEVLPDADPGHRLSARHTCALSEAFPESAPGDIRPIYLRPPDAQLWLERDRGPLAG
jgi:tRNA threonylcarbamoyladenosine biosynthesis protein TsaB